MFETLGIRCGTGEKTRGRYVLGELPDGTQVTLPVRIACGQQDGPTLSVSGMLHGDEFNGLAAINRLFEELDPAALRGTVIGFPMANPFAFITKSRISGLDYERLNGNRVFPGNPGGLIIERVAAAVFDGGVRRANYHIDFHEGGFDFIARYLIVQRPPGKQDFAEQSLKLAKAFGQGIPINYSVITPEAVTLGRGGSISIQAAEVGVPCITNELGGGGCLRPEFVQQGVTGALNVLRSLDMLPGDGQPSGSDQLVGTESMWPRPSRGGIWRQTVELGQVVEADEVVGRVHDAFGDVVEELRAPYRSVIFDIRNTAAIMTGEWTVHCGRLDGSAA